MTSILVVGGNGFVGSAVCRVALSRGWNVTSISSSGEPFRTPKGHLPAWTERVNWRRGNALEPDTYSALLGEQNAVVHTLGTLSEDNKYKLALKNNDLLSLLGSFASSMLGGPGSPLQQGGDSPGSYETINRDAALIVFRTFRDKTRTSKPLSRAFVYLSAEDIFRPLIPERYITSKREAEHQIQGDLALSDAAQRMRAVFVRPSLIYHPHLRPLASPAAALISLSSTVHSMVPPGLPTPSRILRSLATAGHPVDALSSGVLESPLHAMANALDTPPVHVDHVATAICASIEQPEIRGVVDVPRIRNLCGWKQHETTQVA